MAKMVDNCLICGTKLDHSKGQRTLCSPKCRREKNRRCNERYNRKKGHKAWGKSKKCVICSVKLEGKQKVICKKEACRMEQARRFMKKYRSKDMIPRLSILFKKQKFCLNCSQEYKPRKESQKYCTKKCYVEYVRKHAKPKPKKVKKPKIQKPKRVILNFITLECQYCSFQVTTENVYTTKVHQGVFTCGRCLKLEKSRDDGKLKELMAQSRARYLLERAEYIREKIREKAILLEKEREKP